MRKHGPQIKIVVTFHRYGIPGGFFIDNTYIMSPGFTLGHSMESQPPGGMPMPMPAAPATRKTPIGVLILGILVILAGIGLLAVGGLLFAAAFLMAGAGSQVGGLFGAILGIIGAVFVIFGIIAVLAGVGLIRLRPWAWMLTMIIAVLSFLGSLAAVTTYWYLTVLWLVIIVYLVIVRKEFRSRPAGM